MYELLMKVIEKNPRDWEAYLVFADWCEENNQDNKANALRYLAKNGKRPYKEQYLNFRYQWYSIKFDSETDHASNIDHELYMRLWHIGKKSNHDLAEEGFVSFNTFREAIEALMEVY